MQQLDPRTFDGMMDFYCLADIMGNKYVIEAVAISHDVVMMGQLLR